MIKHYKSYLDWIELVYFHNEEKAKEIMNFTVYEKQKLQEKILVENTQKEMHFVEESKAYEIKEERKKELEWEYPYKASCNIPTMTSVSRIKEEDMQNHLPDLLAFTEEKTKPHEAKVPEFLKEEAKITPAKKGSLVHLCLQKLDEKQDYDALKIEEFIQSLIQKQIICKKEAEAINQKALLLYTKSELFNHLKQAKQIYKEVPFYFDMEAKEIVNEEVEEKILVQGIIDLYYIDKEGQMVLVDYKTDFVKEEQELVIKYQKQLDIYKRALEEATSKKVDKVYIYSIYLQKMIAIEG